MGTGAPGFTNAEHTGEEGPQSVSGREGRGQSVAPGQEGPAVWHESFQVEQGHFRRRPVLRIAVRPSRSPHLSEAWTWPPPPPHTAA